MSAQECSNAGEPGGQSDGGRSRMLTCTGTDRRSSGPPTRVPHLPSPRAHVPPDSLRSPELPPSPSGECPSDVQDKSARTGTALDSPRSGDICAPRHGDRNGSWVRRFRAFRAARGPRTTGGRRAGRVRRSALVEPVETSPAEHPLVEPVETSPAEQLAAQPSDRATLRAARACSTSVCICATSSATSVKRCMPRSRSTKSMSATWW